MTGRAICAGLLVLTGALLGMKRTWALKRRLSLLRDLDAALGLLHGEIATLCTPLPQAFRDLAERGPAAAAGFFALLAAKDADAPLAAVWDRGLELLELDGRERQVLQPLGRVLGRYDAARQAAELELTREALSACARELEEEVKGRGRTYPGLGASLGAMLATLLL